MIRLKRLIKVGNAISQVPGGGGGDGVISSAVDTFDDLPSASGNTGKIIAVRTATGILWLTRKSAGLYYSNGTSWTWMSDFGTQLSINGDAVLAGDFNSTTPAAPVGNRNITVQVSGNNFSAYVPDQISVNGAAVLDIDLDDATPAAPAGGTNVKWQIDGSDPKNVSAHLDWGAIQDGVVKKPFLFNDIYSVTNIWPWAAATVSSGTIANSAAETDHPGIGVISCSATQYSGVYSRFEGIQIQISGGERSDQWVKFGNLSEIECIIGFSDARANLGAIQTITDAVCIRVPKGGVAVGINGSNGTLTVSASGYQLSADTWYRFVTWVNAAADSVYHAILAMDGTVLWSDALTTNIPTGAGRQLGHFVSFFTTSAADARVLGYWDAAMITQTKALVG
jgi:hypothetical protein